MVEDNRADVFLIRDSIATARLEAEVHVVSDGEKAIRFLGRAEGDPEAPSPSLVILDLNLPRKPGRDVLRYLRHSLRSANAPVIVVTSSDSDRDREEMRKLGVKGYFRKPSDYDSFMKLGELVRAVLHPEEPLAGSENVSN